MLRFLIGIAFVPSMLLSNATAVAAADLRVDADFPGGNIVVERIEGDVVALRPDLRDTSGWWFYWNFRVRGAGDRTVVFRFSGRSPLGARGPAVSVDGGRTWRWLGKEAMDGRVENASFRYDFDPRVDEVRFAFAMPYQDADWQAFRAEYRQRPNVNVETLCTTPAGRRVEVASLAPQDESQATVLLTARHHACESMASYALEGLIREVLDGGEQSAWLRRHVRFVIIPFMDLDGVEAGDQGKNRKPHDHWLDYAGDSRYPAVAALRERVDSGALHPLRVAIDCHCSYLREETSGPGSSERLFFAHSGEASLFAETQRIGLELSRRQRGPILYDPRYDLPMGAGWNTREMARTSFLGWAERLPDVWAAGVLEIPYANAGGVEVTPDSARRLGRDLATALDGYLRVRQSAR